MKILVELIWNYPVEKSDGSIRICGDYKVTVNREAKLDKYPIPNIDDTASRWPKIF